MLKSIYEDGVNVIGALGWSFAYVPFISINIFADLQNRDNDEFTSYEQQYGMQLINRTDPKLTRSYKRSMFDFGFLPRIC